MPGPAFTVLRLLKQLIHEFGIRLRIGIVFESRNGLRRRWETQQIEIETADQKGNDSLRLQT